MNHAAPPYPAALLLLIAALLSVGCGPTTVSQKLVGKWEGRPDTFAALRQRDPIPTAPGHEPRPDAKPVVESALAEKVARLQPSEKTDLESFDFVVTFDFHADGTVDMLLNGAEKKTGSWRVLSTDVGVSRLELTDSVPDEPRPGEPGTTDQPITKRRFSLKFNEDADGFTLREEGVAPLFGWLYFTKASK